MTEEHVKQLQAIYDEAIIKLEQLHRDKQIIVKDYIKDLETQKLKVLRESLGIQDTH